MKSTFFRRIRVYAPHRIGKPEEIAAAVLFLASEGAGYIDGAELVIDGGTTHV